MERRLALHRRWPALQGGCSTCYQDEEIVLIHFKHNNAMRPFRTLLTIILWGMVISCGRSFQNPLPVQMGDPFLLCPSGGGYYLYGTSEKYDGFVTYRSSDLSSWVEIPPVFDPRQDNAWGISCHWAPEVYERNGPGRLVWSLLTRCFFCRREILS